MKKRGTYKKRENKARQDQGEISKIEEVSDRPDYTGDDESADCDHPGEQPAAFAEITFDDESIVTHWPDGGVDEHLLPERTDRITPDQITDADIKAIERILGRTKSSWHMLDQREIIAACLNHSFVIELK
jgi:hypothetical protein